MTTDEAISVLKNINDLFGAEYENTNPMIAIDMAIKALKDQPKTTYLIRKEDGHQVYWQCANCKNYHSEASDYCSNCGAKMDKKTEDLGL
jgi:hypothetical protein